jgi:xanthine dehydrogenase YagT iron-sulfur-binding subunit
MQESTEPEGALAAAPEPAGGGFSRRRLIITGAAASAGIAVGTAAATVAEGVTADPAAASPTGTGTLDAPVGANPVNVDLVVNGVPRQLQLDPRVTLLDALRDHLSLTGTKKGCDLGQCGACTVHVDGHRVLSCLTLAATVDGRPVTTIEGLANGDTLHPMQQAFIDQDAFQCGYCTSGQIMSAVALVAEGLPATDDDIRDKMSGNICRCGAYANILAAIKSVGRSADAAPTSSAVTA